jgi:hypothetical protein
MTDKSEYEQLLDLTARNLCRSKGIDPEVNDGIHLTQARNTVREIVDKTIQQIALHRATQDIFGEK